MNARIRVSLATASVAALALAGCTSNSRGGAPEESTAPSASASQNSALADKLPAKIRSAGTIVIGTDASYAPNEFLADDGKTVQGMDVDLFNAVAAKFGVRTEWQPADFPLIITGVQGKKYDIGISSFTVDDERKKQATMVSYFSAGTQWATAKGNPKNVDIDEACGKNIAVQTGTAQETGDLPIRQQECEEGNKINILSYKGQDQATAAVLSGKADALLADSPVVAYAVKQAGGKLETLGSVYEAAPYGYVLPKEETEFAAAIVTALQELNTDGTYQQVLRTWGVEQGAISDFAVNP